MPGDPGATVVTNACAYYTSRTRLRVQRAPGIPRSPLGVAPRPLLGGSIMHQLGRYPRRENAKVRVRAPDAAQHATPGRDALLIRGPCST
jgi:hypothetical protein